MDLLLGSLTLQHQLLVGQLQVSGRQVQLLVHFGVLLIHVPQRVQLLGQVLGEARWKRVGEKCLCLGPPPTSRKKLTLGFSCATDYGVETVVQRGCLG